MVARQPPEVFLSDWHGLLTSAVLQTLPLTLHLYCLHHLNGNITQHIWTTLSSDWDNFTCDFWTAYHAVPPEEFEQLWVLITSQYPCAQTHLAEIYNCQECRAWPWVGGPKKALLQLFSNLNKQMDGQTVQQMVHVHESSRHQHVKNIESTFPGPLALLCEYTGPFTLQRCYKEMEDSMFYETEAVKHMINNFANDVVYMSVKWLLCLLNSCVHDIKHLLKVMKCGLKSTHFLIILSDNNYVCNCCMGMNPGVPC
ncbi:hypothetical protein PAXRUDRAFT_31305 [Paxillus rubicundulus Ve08.2h10]|uniref:MULE transposase domain-containing protein n=1 Tax=Paxillus rubicundulus Ve08.2h10 TaxID=930991 RepID=A0A0D0E2H4_9AGAM|nr:hypothetical protein PAXRUDRAFT_31305 [Paxillus rubicundulus Ve08.2h10]